MATAATLNNLVRIVLPLLRWKEWFVLVGTHGGYGSTTAGSPPPFDCRAGASCLHYTPTLGVVAGDPVAGTQLAPRGHFLGAVFLGNRTTCAEAATGGGIDRAWDVALQDDPPPLLFH